MTDDGPQIIRMHGPPGTGKTTRLARRTHSTVVQRGPDAIRIASFSVTAAAEIASREGVRGVLPPRAVGTLHSHAYRAIGQPEVALDPKLIKEWNGRVGTDWRITGDSRGTAMSDRTVGAGTLEDPEGGDQLLTVLDLLRARQTPGERWPIPVRGFAKEWTAWKSEKDYVDFTDMIVRAYELAAAGVPLEGTPSVFVVDEAQDLTPIESALTLAWGALLGSDGRLVFAMDDDQAIMDFRGGDPRMILTAEAADEILAQSFRVPPAVHAVAQDWIVKCSERFPKDYHPRIANPDRDSTSDHSYGWANRVGYNLLDAELVKAVEQDIANGSTVMVLASCGYMLTPLIRALRTRGIPFHNPYRPGETAWNPLGKPTRGMSTPHRILRYLIMDERALGAASRLWTGEDIRAWTHLVGFRAACLARGAERAIEALADGTVAFEHVAALFRDDDAGAAALSAAAEPNLEWFASVITPSKEKTTAYPLQVARSQGPAALMETPRLVVGTIHSVKGAEASIVYLAPDLSTAGMRQWRRGSEASDQTRRLFYVGMTRAYHRLTVLASTSPSAVPPSELIPTHLEVRP